MNNLRRIIAVILVTMMAVSILSACGAAGDSKQTEASSDSVATVKTDTAAADPAKEDAEPKKAEALLPAGEKLTYWSSWMGSKLVTTPGDTEYFKTIQEKTGIPLEFVNSSGGKDQLSILIASGDTPDIIHEWFGNYPGGITKALADGTIIKLNDLMDKGNAPNFKTYLSGDPEADKLCKTDDGTYYVFPMIRLPDSPVVFNGFMIREDWMKELGLEMPKTLKDMEKILVEFKDKKGANFGYSGAWNVYSRIVNAFDTEENFYVDNGKVKYGFLDPQYKDFLTMFSDWMKRGLVDPDLFTQNIDSFYAKVATDKVGFIWGNTGGEFSKIETMKAENPKMNYVPVPNLVREEGMTFNFNISQYRVNNVGGCISKTCKYPEAAAKVLDYAYGEEGHMLSNFGIKDKTYTMVDGYPKFTEFVTKNPDGLSVRQIWEHYAGSNNKAFLVDKRMMEQDYQLPQQRESIVLWLTPDGKLRLLPSLAFTSEESQEYAGIMNEIDTYVKEMKMKFILGVEPISNFDAFTSNLKKMNIDRALQIQQAAFDRFNNR